jgi:hypothetical protein
MQYEDVTYYEVVPYAGANGSAPAVWLRHGEELFLWKEDTPGYNENEVLAYRLGIALGLRIAEYRMAYYEGVLGVLSRDVNSYGVKMINLLEAYPTLKIHNDTMMCLKNYTECVRGKVTEGLCMTYREVIFMLLFDYLIGNCDRHYGNIGVDGVTGDIAPLYDHGPGFSLSGLETEFMLYDIETGKKVLLCEVPQVLLKQWGVIFAKYGSEFYKRYEEVDVYGILLDMQDILGASCYTRYEEELVPLLDERMRMLKEVIEEFMINLDVTQPKHG